MPATQSHIISPYPTSIPALAFTVFRSASLLALLSSTFSQLTADPKTTLLKNLPIVAAVQLIATLQHPSPPPSSTKSKKKGKAKTEASGPNAGSIQRSLSSSLLSLTLSLLIGTPLLTLCTILLGAPLTTHFFETVLLSAHFAALAGVSLVYEVGIDGSQWNRLLEGRKVGGGKEWIGMIGMIIGGWAGAAGIPLDWDREWQKWPVTILTGGYVGYVVARSAAELVVGKGKARKE
ncbi:hypothetical protein BJ508DRAFT_360284 [Ascobolus immersus RN42]|uniref:PIG-F-domain-containing protein n=1 Tax=Ascobolus immersus RN42 TaxID=1160509 RepID=A0A3N4IPQ2_ASCIM|nr:hypothetical protein BJ508DRAFT_360284 [Ascobolus immersus RN42]